MSPNITMVILIILSFALGTGIGIAYRKLVLYIGAYLNKKHGDTIRELVQKASLTSSRKQ